MHYFAISVKPAYSSPHWCIHTTWQNWSFLWLLIIDVQAGLLDKAALLESTASGVCV